MDTPSHSVVSRLGSAALTLLLLLLPSIAATARVADDPRPGELQRVVHGQRPESGARPRSLATRLYYGAALPSAEAADTGDPAVLLPRARFASVGAIFVITGLLYLTLVLARRRTTALIACVALTCLPPVFVDGAVLRREVPAAVFGGLSVLLVMCFPTFLHSRTEPRWSARIAAIMTVGVAIGLATSCLPSAGIYLLIPGAGLVMMMGAVAIETPRILRRMHWESFPLAGLQRRYLPWLLLMLGSIVAALGLMTAGIDGEAQELTATPAAVGLLPENAVAAWGLGLLATLGAFRLLLPVGLRLERLRRVTPEALLLAYSAALVTQWMLGDRRHDALMAAPAMAILIAEGAAMVLLLVRGRFVPRDAASPGMPA